MAKLPVGYTDFLAETMDALREPGCLLATQGRDGTPNAMTIGWGTVGIIWGRPVFLVLVRPSRHTWTLLEENGDFTVNVPPPGLAEAVLVCGTRSGRDLDKFAAVGLTAVPGKHVKAPLVEQCAVHYECRTIYRRALDPAAVADAIVGEAYPSGDFHTVYYGEIIGVVADEDAHRKLGGEA